MVEGFGGSGAESGGCGVEEGDGSRVFVRFEEEAIRRAVAEAVGVVVEAEAEVEAVADELLHLLWLAPEAVPDPRLMGAAVQAENVVEGSHTMDDEGPAEAFAESYLRLEGFELQGVRGTTYAVESALPDEGLRRGSHELCLDDRQPFLPVGLEVPGMQAERGDSSFVLAARQHVGMDVQVERLEL